MEISSTTMCPAQKLRLKVSCVTGNSCQLSDSFIADATVYRWLDPADSSANYHAAREQHHAQTGAWFLHGETFDNWKRTPDSALWIYGTREFVALNSELCPSLYS